MPLPCSQFFLNIFKEYDELRTDDRKSTLNALKSGIERLAGVATGNESVTAKIELIKAEIIIYIQSIPLKKDPRQQFEAWFKLIFILAEKAKDAQNFKYPNPFASKDDESLFCATLHSLRSYIIFKLSSPTANENYKKLYDERVNEFKIKARETRKKYDNSVCHDNGADYKTYMEELEKVTLDLAFLEEKIFIGEAMYCKQLYYLKTYSRYDLIHHKCVPDDDSNEAIPYCLQPKFCKILYEAKFRNHTRTLFEDFEKQAEKSYFEAQKADKLREERSLQSLSDKNENIDDFTVEEDDHELLSHAENEDLTEDNELLEDDLHNPPEETIHTEVESKTKMNRVNTSKEGLFGKSQPETTSTKEHRSVITNNYA